MWFLLLMGVSALSLSLGETTLSRDDRDTEEQQEDSADNGSLPPDTSNPEALRIAEGGEGNDLFYAGRGQLSLYDVMEGGAGNDMFSMSHGASAEGGEGEDLFVFSARDCDAADPVEVTGNEGHDIFLIEVNTVTPSEDAPDVITDFNAAEDSLGVLCPSHWAEIGAEGQATESYFLLDEVTATPQGDDMLVTINLTHVHDPDNSLPDNEHLTPVTRTILLENTDSFDTSRVFLVEDLDSFKDLHLGSDPYAQIFNGQAAA